MTYNEAADLLRSNNCPVFEGEMNPTLFGIRTNDDYTNAFTDLIGVLWTEYGKNNIALVNGTTKPGLYGDGAITSPKWIHGIFGTAVMVPGHYKGLWKMVNFNLIDQGKGAPPKAAKSFNPWQYPYLHQVGKCRIWRDGDMDLKITKTVEVDSINDGINFHYMSNDQTPSIYIDDNLNNWSLGCNGAPAQQLAKVFSVLNRCRTYTGEVISYSLIRA